MLKNRRLPLPHMNFFNVQTYQVFRWVLSSSEIDVDRLIARAFEMAGVDPRYTELELDLSNAVLMHLDHLIEEEITEGRFQWFNRSVGPTDLLRDHEEPFADESTEGDGWAADWGSLFVPILNPVMEDVNYNVVA